ncbi:MAG: VOC family protein, partial [Chloroflexota bacterium]
HHIGLNTWHSKDAPPAPEGTAGLRSFVITLPSQDALSAVIARLDAAGVTHTGTEDVIVRDPWTNTIVLRVAPSR